MITRKNYLSEIKGVDFSKLHKDIIDAKEFFDEMTKNGTDYDLVDSEDGIKEAIDLYFEALKKVVKVKVTKTNTKKKSEPESSRSSSRSNIEKKKIRPRKSVSENKPKRLPRKPRPDLRNATKVELVDLELKFIRRYVNMHGKVKLQNQIRLFLNSLQKAIIERRIRKTSSYAKEIVEIQDDLIMLNKKLKKSKNGMPIVIGEKRLKHYYKLIGKQVERESTKLIKSYVSLQGKLTTNFRVKNLLKRIGRAIDTGKISKNDKYWEEVEVIQSNLDSFIQKNENGGTLSVGNKELNGLNGILNEDFEAAPTQNMKNTVMRSTDFLKVKFDKLNFRGKWLDFIGNPSQGFKTMIFGLPKYGKSYLMVDFAGYLVRNHGTVLYVAKEEELDDTLQQKLKDKDVEHPDLYVSDYIPSDLSPYDFVFLDSVTKLRLSPDDLEELSHKYPKISFVYVFQTTKHGAFRGSNEFQHDVDVVIEVPEKGKAIQFGRFNQGGEIEIFDNTRDAA